MILARLTLGNSLKRTCAYLTLFACGTIFGLFLKADSFYSNFGPNSLAVTLSFLSPGISCSDYNLVPSQMTTSFRCNFHLVTGKACRKLPASTANEASKLMSVPLS